MDNAQHIQYIRTLTILNSSPSSNWVLGRSGRPSSCTRLRSGFFLVAPWIQSAPRGSPIVAGPAAAAVDPTFSAAAAPSMAGPGPRAG